jgi:hypothetical protein
MEDLKSVVTLSLAVTFRVGMVLPAWEGPMEVLIATIDERKPSVFPWMQVQVVHALGVPRRPPRLQNRRFLEGPFRKPGAIQLSDHHRSQLLAIAFGIVLYRPNQLTVDRNNPSPGPNVFLALDSRERHPMQSVGTKGVMRPKNPQPIGMPAR